MKRGKSSCWSGSSSRRDFLKRVGAGAAAAPFIAGPFQTSSLFVAGDHYVPADKKLSRVWRRRLFAKGHRKIYRGGERATIGMPVGGIGAGQLYVGGDGTLRLWDITNEHKFSGYGAKSYEYRVPPRVVEHGFAVAVKDEHGETKVRRLREEDVPEVEFVGEYPIAEIRYPAGDFPIEVSMRVFTPFIPLGDADSTLPATIFQITLSNRSDKPVKASLLSWIENFVMRRSGPVFDAVRTNMLYGEGKATHMVCLCGHKPSRKSGREDRASEVFADFEKGPPRGWKAEGDAFATPISRGANGGQSPVRGFRGKGLLNSFTASSGDAATGALTSPVFEIRRRFMNFLIGGGNDVDRTRIELLVDGRVRFRAAGQNREQLEWHSFDVADFVGKRAQIRIVDRSAKAWGHINLDQIEFDDIPKRGTGGFQQQADFGTVGMVYFDEVKRSSTDWDGESLTNWLATVGDEPAAHRDNPLGLVEQAAAMGPHATRTLTCALTWFFPNHEHGHVYANRFASSIEVGDYLFDQRERLIGDTLAFHSAYYDSSLPHWLLDRLIAPVGNLATGTCQVWKDGRFWAWEGVGCCSGTCTHVWNYEHALARLFPALARSTREMQDLGEGFHDDGLVGFRSNDRFAADGQAGTVLKIFREHLMSADDAFLRRNWKKTKKALEYLIGRDANADGLLENSQHNTYDIEFYGPNTFVGGLYLAALRAGEEMAKLSGDTAFARLCRKIFDSGSRRTMELLFNGEYFVQKVDLEKHPRHQYADGCLADQLFGQGWAHQVGLGDLYPRTAILATLRSIYKYNWAPDVGPQNARHAPERYFARKGEAGLFLCTWPKSKHLGRNGVRYRNEIWTGIEYQVAGHMLAEGLLEEGLSIIRGVHERYDGAKFNPFNEVECGDHYARALASWGCLLGLAGFEYDGPAGRLGFRPQMSRDQFRTFFTAAEGWGSLSQTRVGRSQSNRVHLRWGRLRLRELHLRTEAALSGARVRVALGATDLPVRATHRGDGRFELKLGKDVVIEKGQVLHVSFEG